MNSGRLLIIDDEPFIVDILRRRFQRIGYTVQGAYDVKTAIALLKNEEYDLVICDLHIDGHEGACTILESMQQHNTGSKLVAMSGLHPDDSSVQEIMRMGASAFLKKPFTSMADVTASIVKLLS